MTPQETPDELRSRVGRFIGALDYLEHNDAGGDRATMAALRAGLRHKNGIAVEMMAFVAPYLAAKESKTDERWFQIAALFAIHPQNTRGDSFAQAFRKLADKGSESIEKRFQLLLSCDGEDLFRHLTQCIGLLSSQGLAVNWYKLLLDLTSTNWDNPNRTIQLRWAREFYRAKS